MTAVFKTQTLASLCLACHFFRLCVILNGSLQTSDILRKSHTYVENVAVLVHATTSKKYDFLPVGNFLFMSESRSIEGDSGHYLNHFHASPEVTPVLMMQDAMKPNNKFLNTSFFFSCFIFFFFYHFFSLSLVTSGQVK